MINEVAHEGPNPTGLDSYDTELERTKSQLLVFAKEISSVYQKEREKAKSLGRLNEELKADYLSIVETLAMVVEAKDHYTGRHLERCRTYGTALARAIDPDLVSPELQYGFLLHDVGKIGVPEAILSKKGPLSHEEFEIMRRHPLIGVQLIEPMGRILDWRTLQIVRHHHERFDGKGYPDGLKGSDIPLAARIFTVVDSFDAMTTDRPYRAALPLSETLRRLTGEAGAQFDPEVVTAFVALLKQPEFQEIFGDRRP